MVYILSLVSEVDQNKLDKLKQQLAEFVSVLGDKGPLVELCSELINNAEEVK